MLKIWIEIGYQEIDSHNQIWIYFICIIGDVIGRHPCCGKIRGNSKLVSFCFWAHRHILYMKHLNAHLIMRILKAMKISHIPNFLFFKRRLKEMDVAVLHSAHQKSQSLLILIFNYIIFFHSTPLQRDNNHLDTNVSQDLCKMDFCNVLF